MTIGLHTVVFLREHGPAELERRLAVRAVRHRAYPNLALFKYGRSIARWPTRSCRSAAG